MVTANLRKLEDGKRLNDYFKVFICSYIGSYSYKAGEKAIAHAVQKLRRKSLPAISSSNKRNSLTHDKIEEEEKSDSTEGAAQCWNTFKFQFEVPDNSTMETVRNSFNVVWKNEAKVEEVQAVDKWISGQAGALNNFLVVGKKNPDASVCNNYLSTTQLIPLGYRHRRSIIPCLCPNCKEFT